MVDVDAFQPNPHVIAIDSESSEATPLLGSHSVQPLSKEERRVGRIQFFALCCSLFVIGWNDGSIGPLLPRIQKVYEVRSSSQRHSFHNG